MVTYLQVREPPSVWNLHVVLSKLMEPPFKPLSESSIYSLTLKTVLWVVINLARTVSERQALMSEHLYTSFCMGMVILIHHAKSILKVVSEVHLSQSVNLPLFFLKLHTRGEKATYSGHIQSSSILH